MPNSYFSKCAKAALFSVASGATIGASTNAINSYISPEYYQIILEWDFQGIWAASVAQGVMEGVAYGVLFSIVILVSILIFRRGTAWPKVAQHILKAIFLVYLSWLLGGMIALLLASISPDFYMGFIDREGIQVVSLLKFAWVGGSIKGAMYGALVGALITAIAIKNDVPQLRPKVVI